MNSCAAMNATKGSASGQAAAFAKASTSRFCASAGGGLGTLEHAAPNSRPPTSTADRTTMAFLLPQALVVYTTYGNWVDAARRRRLLLRMFARADRPQDPDRRRQRGR